MMPGQRLRVNAFPQPPQQRPRALNAGEQERERIPGTEQKARPGSGSYLPVGGIGPRGSIGSIR